MTTLLDIRRADAMARRFANEACREKHGSLTRAAQYGQWFIEALKDAGLSERRKDGTDLHEVLFLVLDALGSAHGLIEREADHAGIAPEDFPLDLNELKEMHASMTPKPRFPETFCSCCGQGFGPGDHGFSHCENHAHLRGKP